MLTAAPPPSASVDVTIPGHAVHRGRLHLLTQIRREIEDIFLGMGYEVWDGAEVATVWENFDALTSDRRPSVALAVRHLLPRRRRPCCARTRRPTRSARC